MTKKTSSVRIPNDLVTDIGIIAAALNMTVPEWCEQALRSAAAKDLPKAGRIVKDRVEQAGKSKPE